MHQCHLQCPDDCNLFLAQTSHLLHNSSSRILDLWEIPNSIFHYTPDNNCSQLYWECYPKTSLGKILHCTTGFCAILCRRNSHCLHLEQYQILQEYVGDFCPSVRLLTDLLLWLILLNLSL